MAFNSRFYSRGATFILVLALLSLLIFVAAAFTYTSRLEAIAASNFSQSTEAQMAAATGLSSALPYVKNATCATSRLQAWARVQTSQDITPAGQSASSRHASGSSTHSSAHSASIQQHTQAAAGSQPADFSITDLSGRVNVNAIYSQHGLEKFLKAVFENSDKHAAGATPRTRAKAMFDFRKTDPDTSSTLQPDLRRRAGAKTRRFENLGDLRQHRTTERNLFTEQELKVLANYTTVFSQSPEMFNRPDGGHVIKPNLETASVEQILTTLRKAFPGRDERLLMQYAANIVDYRDEDAVPTIVTDPSHPEVWNTILGAEYTPLISEVYPDALTDDDSDDGQFIEIFNPWDKSLAMANWKLSVGSSVVSLNVTLPPHGYVIVTDNYDQPSDKSKPGTGSFVSIFGMRKDNSMRQVIERSELDIPDTNSFVKLTDANGNLIDVFGYTNQAQANSKMSYQRDDPRVRSFSVMNATPFQQPAPSQKARTAQTHGSATMYPPTNSGSLSPAELMKVSTSYSSLGTVGTKTMMQPYPYQLPLFAHSDQTSSSDDTWRTNLDAYVLDLFTTARSEESTDPVEVVSSSSHQTDRLAPRGQTAQQQSTPAPSTVLGMYLQSMSSNAQDSGLQKIAWPTTSSLTANSTTQTQLQLIYSYGKININTCPKEAFYALDAVTHGRDRLTAEVIQQIDTYRTRQLAAGKTPFENPSDFLLNLVPDATVEHLPLFDKLISQITVNSSSFEIVSNNRVPNVRKSDENRRAAQARMRWTISLDKEPLSLISFSSQP